jgi:hypothetical protein
MCTEVFTAKIAKRSEGTNVGIQSENLIDIGRLTLCLRVFVVNRSGVRTSDPIVLINHEDTKPQRSESGRRTCLDKPRSGAKVRLAKISADLRFRIRTQKSPRITLMSADYEAIHPRVSA